MELGVGAAGAALGVFDSVLLVPLSDDEADEPLDDASDALLDDFDDE